MFGYIPKYQNSGEGPSTKFLGLIFPCAKLNVLFYLNTKLKRILCTQLRVLFCLITKLKINLITQLKSFLLPEYQT